MSNEIVPFAPSALAFGALDHPRYLIRRPFRSVLGRSFQVFAPDGSLAMFVKHPMFKIKPEFTVCTDATERLPLIVVRSPKAIALDRVFHVTAAQTGELLGTLRSHGLKSIWRDTWDILDGAGQPIGLVQEDGHSLLRRFFPFLLDKWHVELQGETLATVRQRFKWFTKEFNLDLSAARGRIDTRLVIACAMLALMAETAREATK